MPVPVPRRRPIEHIVHFVAAVPSDSRTKTKAERWHRGGVDHYLLTFNALASERVTCVPILKELWTSATQCGELVPSFLCH
jgi:hypothetical protein